MREVGTTKRRGARISRENDNTFRSRFRRCSGKVELSFRLGHDGPIKNAILDYRLEILPIFIKFESHDQLFIPIDKPDEDAIAAWIDDKLVEFTRTYFEMYFTEQYQQQNFTRDPVMNIRFPKAYAVGKKEYQGPLITSTQKSRYRRLRRPRRSMSRRPEMDTTRRQHVTTCPLCRRNVRDHTGWKIGAQERFASTTATGILVRGRPLFATFFAFLRQATSSRRRQSTFSAWY